MSITLLRKAGSACCPILGGELVSRVESAGGMAVRKAKRPKAAACSAYISAEENSEFQGIYAAGMSLFILLL
ncbi:hypothetical protein [Anaerotignum sp.]